MPGACNFSLDVKPIYKLTPTLHAHAKPVIPAGARVLNNLGYQFVTLTELLNLYCKTLGDVEALRRFESEIGGCSV